MRVPTSIIESIGIHLPDTIVSSAEVMRGCEQPTPLQLERLTGIRNRRVAGDGCYSIDLAKAAVEKCLAASRHRPSDIDLVVCCNMSRHDGPDFHYNVEPSTAVRLRRHFGFGRALAFDVGNACGGMFTAIHLVDALLKARMIRTALVVSGEYITHLMRTAQREISEMPDPRMACLTLGDSGAALILERATRPGTGFHAIGMHTSAAFGELSIARPTEREHGGAIMFTDSRGLHDVAIRQSAQHIARTLAGVGWGKEALQHVVIHQTSERFFYEAAIQVNDLVGDTFCDEKNMVDNLRERGNTATTTHMLAVWDSIQNGRVRSGDNVLFAIQASGLTIGTAAYTFDDLPDRIKAAGEAAALRPQASGIAAALPASAAPVPALARIRMESWGLAGMGADDPSDGLTLAAAALDRCLETSVHKREDVALLVFAGVHRDGFLGEPAMAAMIAQRARLNEEGVAANGKSTFAFDLSNGAVGFLQACHAAAGFIRAGAYPMAMVVASEAEPNKDFPGQPRLGIAQAGSAVILGPSPDAKTGFGNFLFKSFDEHLEAHTSWLVQSGGKTGLASVRSGELEALWLACIPSAVHELLALEGLGLDDIGLVLPPQVSGTFVPKLRAALGAGAPLRIVDAVAPEGDPYSSTLVHGLHHARRAGWAQPGDIGLIIHAGSGLQIGCAIYYF